MIFDYCATRLIVGPLDDLRVKISRKSIEIGSRRKGRGYPRKIHTVYHGTHFSLWELGFNFCMDFSIKMD